MDVQREVGVLEREYFDLYGLFFGKELPPVLGERFSEFRRAIVNGRITPELIGAHWGYVREITLLTRVI